MATGVSVTVDPAKAGIAVDGRAVKVNAGVFTVEGAVGSAHVVSVTYGGRSQAFRVVVTENGAEPKALKFVRQAVPAAPGPVSPQPAPAPATDDSVYD